MQASLNDSDKATDYAKSAFVLKKSIGARSALRREILLELNKQVCKIGQIPFKDFLSFANGRVDAVGNFIIQDFDESTNENSVTTEQLIFLEVRELLVAYRGVIQRLTAEIYDRTSRHKGNYVRKLRKEFSEIERKYGSMEGVVYYFGGALTPLTSLKIDSTPIASLSVNPLLNYADKPIGCQIGSEGSCPSDRLDCGVFDLCQLDSCGLGDNTTKCWLYDSAGDDKPKPKS